MSIEDKPKNIAKKDKTPILERIRNKIIKLPDRSYKVGRFEPTTIHLVSKKSVLSIIDKEIKNAKNTKV